MQFIVTIFLDNSKVIKTYYDKKKTQNSNNFSSVNRIQKYKNKLIFM